MTTTGGKVLLGAGVVGALWYAFGRRRAHAATSSTTSSVATGPRGAIPDVGAAAALPGTASVPSSSSAPAPSAAPAPWVTVDEVEALAAVIDSESDDGTSEERTWIAWAVRNRAESRGVSIVRLVCSPHCGPQRERISGHGVRPFSSARRPRAATRELARVVLALPKTQDPTQGANAFIEPSLQDKLHQAGHADHQASETVRARWLAEGQRPVRTVGHFEFWRGAA